MRELRLEAFVLSLKPLVPNPVHQKEEQEYEEAMQIHSSTACYVPVLPPAVGDFTFKVKSILIT
jgi:hypothetical protein